MIIHTIATLKKTKHGINVVWLSFYDSFGEKYSDQRMGQKNGIIEKTGGYIKTKTKENKTGKLNAFN